MADKPESNGTPPPPAASAPAAEKREYLIGGAILKFPDDVKALWDTVKKKIEGGAGLGEVFKNMWIRTSMHFAWQGQQINDLEQAVAKLSPEFRRKLNARNRGATPARD